MEVSKVERGRFTPRVDESLATTCDTLLGAVGRDDVALLDVRNRSEYTGENARGNQRRGHVPGAVHLEWTDFMTGDARKAFKPAAELRSLLRERGVTPDKRVHVY
jgi:thiosulfate/3-mercaptopyruvate sulfurtransferase